MLASSRVMGELIRYEFLSLRSETDYIVLHPPCLFHLKDTIILLSFIEVRVWLCLLCTKAGFEMFLINGAFLFKIYQKQTRHPAHKIIHSFNTVSFAFHFSFTTNNVFDANLRCPAITMDLFLSSGLHRH